LHSAALVESPEITEFVAACERTPAELLPELYEQLRRMARRRLRGERGDHSLNTTALVHEAWLRLVASYPELSADQGDDFLALSAHLMRRVLTDHARHRGRQKRGGELEQVTYTEGLQSPPDAIDPDILIALDRALNQLEQIDARQVRVVELRYFSGLAIDETARVLGLSPATIKREWSIARAWLYDALQGRA
jgi:RNA polymerase sigma factor (TIGR02999 family)